MSQVFTDVVKNQGEQFEQLRREQARHTNSPVASSSKEEAPGGEKPIMILLENYTVKDDATTVVDMRLRNMLRPMNMKPEKVGKLGF